MDFSMIYQEYGFTIILAVLVIVAAHVVIRLLITHRIPQTTYEHITEAITRGANAIKKKLGEKKRQKELLEDLKQRTEEPKAKTTDKQKASQLRAKQSDYIDAIRNEFKKIPIQASERYKLEVSIARSIVREKGKFSISDVMKKIDETYQGKISRQERIDIYDDIKRWAKGELCQSAGNENGVNYFKFV